jgi:glycosidase
VEISHNKRIVAHRGCKVIYLTAYELSFGDAMIKGFINKKHNQTLRLDHLLGEMRNRYPLPAQYQLQNIMGSHDNERFASMLINPDRWIDHGGNLVYNKDFKVNRPSESDRQIQKAILVFQFTYVGAPYIYYGDEVGMWGADDPDNRKPMVWADMEYEPEVAHPLGMNKPVDSVVVDQELLKFYKAMVKLRKDHSCLRQGNYKTIFLDDKKGIFVFERYDEDEQIRVIFNLSNKPQSVATSQCLGDENWNLLSGDLRNFKIIPPKSSGIYIRK